MHIQPPAGPPTFKKIMRVVAYNPGMTYSAAREWLMEGVREDQARYRRAIENRYAEGTGVKSLRKIQTAYEQTGVLTRKQKAIVRRALSLGKAVPEPLQEAVNGKGVRAN